MKSRIGIALSLALACTFELLAASDLTEVVAAGLGKSRLETAKACASGKGHHGDGPPYRAFDGVRFTGRTSDRWFASIDPEKTYLQFDIPDELLAGTTVFVPTAYEVAGSSEAAKAAYKRSPASWLLLGRRKGSETWETIDAQEAVVWPNPMAADNCSHRFQLPAAKQTVYASFRFIPLSSLLTERWNVAISELSIEVEAIDAPALLIRSDIPAVAPAAGLFTGDARHCTAEPVYEKDGYRFHPTGYELATLVDGEWVSDGVTAGATSYDYARSDKARCLTWLWRQASYLEIESNEGPDFGAPSPAYGRSSPHETTVCQAPPFLVDDILYSATHHVIETRNDAGEWSNAVTNEGNRHTFDPAGPSQRLTWLWAPVGAPLDVTVSPAGEGHITTVTPPDLAFDRYTFGKEITLTAEDAPDAPFRIWLSTLPPVEAREGKTLTFPIGDTPQHIAAVYDKPWIVDETGKSMTDGNWVLNVTLFKTNVTVVVPVSATDPTILNLAAPVRDASGNDLALVKLEGGSLSGNKPGMAGCVFLVLPDCLQTIANSALYNLPSLVRIHPFFPDSLTYLGQSALDGSKRVRGCVRLGFGPENVKYNYSGQLNKTAIEELRVGPMSAATPSCQGCTSLTNVFLHEGITSISSFSGCGKLVHFEPFLPKGYTWIDQQVFSGTPITNDLVLGFGDKEVTFKGNLHFSGIASRHIRLGPQVKKTGDSTFKSCTKLETLELDDGMTAIADGSFGSCPKLRSVTPFLPSSLRSLGKVAFQSCGSLASPLVYTATNPIYMGPANYNNQGTFTWGSSLPSADLSGGITNLPGGFFLGCKKLGEVRLGPKLETFDGTCNFQETLALTNLWFYGPPPKNPKEDLLFRDNPTKKLRVYVPQGDPGWAAFAAERVTPMDDALRAEYETLYPNDKRQPKGLFTMSGIQIWYCTWRPPTGIKGLMLMFR